MTALFAEANVQFVLRTLLRLGAPQSDLEDLGQEVFVIVHRRAREFDGSRRVEPWLYGIARNVMRDYWRKNKARREVLGHGADVAEDERIDDDTAAASADDSVSLLRQAVSRLPDPLLDVLTLSDLVGMTLAETALELDIPIDTAKDRLRRARRDLRTVVQRLEAEAS